MSVKTFTIERQAWSRAGEDQTHPRRRATSTASTIPTPVPPRRAVATSAPAASAWSRSQGSRKLQPACLTAGRGGHGGHDRHAERLQSYRRHDRRAALRRAEPRLLGLRVERPLRAAGPGATRLGMDHVRFALPAPDAARSTPSHRRFGIDHNRCILCTRCVRVCDEIEGAHTWDVAGRGAELARHHRPRTQPWGESRDLHQLRQVRAGLPDRRALREGRGRGRDGARTATSSIVPQDRAGEEAMDPVSVRTSARSRASPRSGSAAAPAATCRSSTSTSGCIELAARRSTSSTARSMDVKEFPEDVDVALVEGAVANEEHLRRCSARSASASKVLVSFGDCAVTGNVTALRNPLRRRRGRAQARLPRAART